jgi:molybdenum cofactor biosynthesis protein B
MIAGLSFAYYQDITDDAELIATSVGDVIQSERRQVILMNGGTGITKKDVTIEAPNPMFTKTLTGFGPLFTKLSFPYQSALMTTRV